MKRILVTGGAGFIGSHLCEALIKEGNFVFCLDNLYSGSMSNILSLLKHDKFQFINQNVIQPIRLSIDEIYHLACPASPKAYQKDPIFTLDTNYLGSKNMLELATVNNATILLASTSEVYGDPLVHPQIEAYFGNVNPIGVRSCYDEGKRISETLFFDFHRKFKTKIKVARIFNTYGPNMDIDDGRVVSNFIMQSLLNKPLTVYGKGNQTRSFCYVQDMVEALMELMNSSNLIQGPFNIGNPDELSILSIAEKILFFTESSAKIEYHPLPSDDPKSRKPNIELFTRETGWSPKIGLDEGLERTIHFFRAKLISLRNKNG